MGAMPVGCYKQNYECYKRGCYNEVAVYLHICLPATFFTHIFNRILDSVWPDDNDEM